MVAVLVGLWYVGRMSSFGNLNNETHTVNIYLLFILIKGGIQPIEWIELSLVPLYPSRPCHSIFGSLYLHLLLTARDVEATVDIESEIEF